MLRIAAICSLLILTLACAGIARQEPIPARPLQPASGERVIVDHALLLFDASGSICEKCDFPGEKALFEAFVAGMPAGDYAAGSLAFGGYERQIHPVGPFDRGALAASAREIRYLSEGTPIDRVLAELTRSVGGKGKRAAVVLFSDGRPTDPVGRPTDPARTLEAARALDAAYDGPVCFHTVQVGDDPSGAAFLDQLSKLTGCGTSRTIAATANIGALDRFEREVFLGVAQAPKPRAALPGDEDGDGVTDDKDQCPGTLAGAKVDVRGCWSIRWLEFATNSAEIRPEGRARLVEEVLPVLKANPGVRVRIDGHTDSRGSDAYNQGLSERRAKSVHDFLVGQGVASGRLESRGFGESKPIVPNDTPANLQRNRRTELTVL